MLPARSTVIVVVVLASLLAVGAGAAGAQDANAGGTNERTCSLDPADLRPLVDTLNRNVDQVPGFARSQFGGERIDVRVGTPDGERRFSLTTAKDGRITDFEAGAPDDPTLRVETSRSTFCDVVTADDPRAAFVDAYYGGDIEVTGVGSVNAAKVGAVKIGATISRVLSGLFGFA